MLLSDNGLSVEAAPVLRNVLNHAYALRWLVDNGALAVDALIAADIDGAEKMYSKLERADWPNAVEYRRLLEERKAQTAAAGTDVDGQRP